MLNARARGREIFNSFNTGPSPGPKSLLREAQVRRQSAGRAGKPAGNDLQGGKRPGKFRRDRGPAAALRGILLKQNPRLSGVARRLLRWDRMSPAQEAPSIPF